MREEIRRMFSEYQTREKELKILKFRITNFKGIEPDDVIKSMCLSGHEGEKVQTSGPSDRTASAALNYRRMMTCLTGFWRNTRRKKRKWTSSVSGLAA